LLTIVQANEAKKQTVFHWDRIIHNTIDYQSVFRVQVDCPFHDGLYLDRNRSNEKKAYLRNALLYLRVIVSASDPNVELTYSYSPQGHVIT